MMDLLDSTPSVVRRPVKHARLRVGEDEKVELIVPADFTPHEIQSVLRRKADWIERQREFFRQNPRNTRELTQDEVLLFGEVFRWTTAAEPGRRVVVDRNAVVIRASADACAGEQRQRWLREFARTHLKQRVEELSRKHGFRYGRCFVRSQRTRWGNCSRKGNVSLNWRLVAAPEYVIDYVILHELVHTRMMDHSQRFWVRLRALCLECAKAMEWLRRNRDWQKA